MMIRYGTPTFIVRKECPEHLLDILEKLAAKGFDGIELFTLYGYDDQTIKAKCDEVGLTVICDHVSYDEFVNDPQGILAERRALDLKYIAIDDLPADKLPGTPGFSEAVLEIEKIGKLAKESGMQLLYHNQGFDVMTKVDQKTMLEVLLDSISPDLLKFQIDLGWLAIGGADPVYFLDKYRDRCPIVHLKDYYATGPVLLKRAIDLATETDPDRYKNFEFRPTGYGIMNFPALMPKVLKCKPDWIVADHDLSVGRDSIDDLGLSLDYVKELSSFYGGIL